MGDAGRFSAVPLPSHAATTGRWFAPRTRGYGDGQHGLLLLRDWNRKPEAVSTVQKLTRKQLLAYFVFPKAAYPRNSSTIDDR